MRTGVVNWPWVCAQPDPLSTVFLATTLADRVADLDDSTGSCGGLPRSPALPCAASWKTAELMNQVRLVETECTRHKQQVRVG